MNFTISFTVPDSEADALVDDLAEAYGYTDTVADPSQNTAVPSQIANPLGKLDYVKQTIGKELLVKVLDVRAARAHAVMAEQTSTAAAALLAACAVS